MEALEPSRPRPAEGRPFRIGTWRVDPGLDQISRDDTTRHLEPRAADLLLCLSERPGEVLSKRELLDRVWGGAYVTEGVLKRAVWELRRALEDDARDPRWIQTVPRRGYRLIAPVIREADAVASMPEAESPDARTYSTGKELTASTPAHHPSTRVLRWAKPLLLIAVAGLATWRREAPPAEPATLRPVPLTALQGREKDPALSPDGSRLAFAWNSEGQVSDLYVQVVGSEHRLQLTHNDRAHDDQPVFSPDGNRIAFVRSTKNPQESGIYLVSSLGGPARRLLSVPSNRVDGISWSPVGDVLAAAWRPSPGAPSSIHLVPLEDPRPQLLTDPPPNTWGDAYPTFSPDGKTIAFTRALTPRDHDLYRIATSGGEPHRLTHDHTLVLGLAWLDEGRSLVYSSDRLGPRALWKIAADGGEAEWFSGAAEGGLAPASDLGGHRLVFEQARCDSDVWRYSDEASTAGIVRSTRRDQFPQLSPDDTRLAFVSDRTGDYEIYRANADGSSAVRLTTLRGPHVNALRWSPDGRSIAFETWQDGQSDIFVVDADGAVVRRVTHSPNPEVAPGWSADGRSVYFGARSDGRWQAWRVDATGGVPHLVTDRGGYAAMESPDGRHLYYSKHDEPGLWRQPVDSDGNRDTEELVVAAFDRAQRIDWTVTREGLYYLDTSPAGTGVAFFAFENAETSLRFPLDALPIYPGLTVAADGDSALLTRVTRFESDVLMIERGPTRVTGP